jgi:hypothetical protein
MRRVTAAVVCVIATTFAAAAAEAATSTAGRYEGRTEQSQFLRFNVAADRRHVLEFAIGVVGMNCSDDTQTSVPVAKTSRSRRFKIDSKGRFGIRSRDYRICGRVGARRATGTVRMAIRVDSSGRPDPAGAVTCDSGTVRWSARPRR